MSLRRISLLALFATGCPAERGGPRADGEPDAASAPPNETSVLNTDAPGAPDTGTEPSCSQVWVHEDADGDGLGASDVSESSCWESLPEGKVTNGDDCDDSDPSGLGNDTDADGDGTPSYCLDPSVEERFKDCDDDDPTRHPDAEDIPFDGIDSNCDSADFSLNYGCEELTSLTLSELPPPGSCDGPDLFIAALSDCWQCDREDGGVISYLDFIVGNRGTAPTEAALHFDGVIADFELGTLEPRSVSETLRMEGPFPELLLVRIVARDGRENCAGAADSARLEYRLFCDPR